MYARNKHNGCPIVSTLQIVYGAFNTADDSFTREPDGSLKFENDGDGTELFWDSTKTATNDRGRIFLDANGDEVAEADVELTTELTPDNA